MADAAARQTLMVVLPSLGARLQRRRRRCVHVVCIYLLFIYLSFDFILTSDVDNCKYDLDHSVLNTMVMPCDLGRSLANIYGSSVVWLENTGMSTQRICYLYFILVGIKITLMTQHELRWGPDLHIETTILRSYL